jgi:hypothetical protein
MKRYKQSLKAIPFEGKPSQWKVCWPNRNWIGIIETNFAYAFPYWTKKGMKLIPCG